MHIAIFGSAFDPPTLGHADAIDYVLTEHRQLDKVLLVPAYRHAFGKSMLSYATRKEMLELFVTDLNDPRIHALPIEHKINKAGDPVYTYDLLTFLANGPLKGAQLSFIIGPDNQANWHKFHKADQITQNWSIIVVPERKTIRSTQIRQAVKQGDPIDDLVTPSVATFIQQQGLYE